MLDTVTIRAAWPLREKLPDILRFKLEGCVTLWLASEGDMVKLVECSLPRLFFGHNGRLLANQMELTAALEKLKATLDTVAQVPDVAEWKLFRADMTWNFDLRAKALIMAHAALRVPGIQSGATLFRGGQGVSWGGKQSRFMVKLYNKSEEMRVQGSVLRAEILLRGQQLTRRLKGNWQNFADLYRAYRSIMASIPPIQTPTKATNWQAAIGAEPLDVRQRVLARLSHKSKETFRRYRREIEAAAANLPETFSWIDILPPENPPPPVNVEPHNRRKA